MKNKSNSPTQCCPSCLQQYYWSKITFYGRNTLSRLYGGTKFWNEKKKCPPACQWLPNRLWLASESFIPAEHTVRQCCCVNMNCNVGVFSHFMLSQRTQNTHDPQDLKRRLRWTLVTFKTQKVTFKLLYSQQYTIYIYIYLILTSFFLQIVQYNLSLEAVLSRSSNTHRLLRLRPDSAAFCGTRPCWSRPCCWEPALPPAWGT